MLHAIGVITQSKLMVLRNNIWRGDLRKKLRWGMLFLVLGLLALSIYGLMRGAVSSLRNEFFLDALREAAQENPRLQVPTTLAELDAYLVGLPSTALLIALLMMLLTSFSTVLSSLYLSGDIDMLLVAPVPMRAVFVVKFFGGLSFPYLLLFMLLAPALLGFGHGMGYGPAYYVAALLAVLLLPLLPFSLGALLVMAVVRIIPAKRAREIVGVLGGLFGLAWYAFSQLSYRFSPSSGGAQMVGLLGRLNSPLLPSAWAGRAVAAAGAHQWATTLAYGLPFALVSLGGFAAALVLGERIYYAGWANMSSESGRVRRREPRGQGEPQAPLAMRIPGLPVDAGAILFKDLRLFARDLRNVQQLLFPLMMSGFWIYQLFTSSPTIEDAPSAVNSALGLLTPVGISTFICLTFSSALGGPNISREGKAFWILRLAPISTRRLLLGKFALAFLPYPIMGTLFIGLISYLQHALPQHALVAWLIVQIVGVGLSAITLGIGASFPKFDWEKPTDQNSLQAGCLMPIFYILYLALALGAIVGLPLTGTLLPAWAWLLGLLGWALGLGLTALVAWGFLGLGARQLDKLEF
ncbi:hypothetical protein F8S13_15110 [Chloroflexia bacterium SDU3-3]|nr:hypothetical protein F8S13_15110 [Chloroflexia bacterium SDU3-3]